MERRFHTGLNWKSKCFENCTEFGIGWSQLAAFKKETILNRVRAN